MDIGLKSGHPEKQRTACIVVGVFDARRLSPQGAALDKASDGAITQILRRGDCEGRLGQRLLLHHIPNILAERVLLIGCGKEREFDERAFKRVIRQTVSVLQNTGALEAICCLTELSVKGRDTDWNLRQASLVAQQALYDFDAYKSKKETQRRPIKKLVYTVASRKALSTGEQSIAEGAAIAEGMTLTRDLGNTPPNICTPAFLAKEAKKLADKHTRLTTTILEEKDLKTLGMGALLAVGQGSANAPKLITMNYKGGKKSAKPIVIVGKGITFDTGGYSLKPPRGMMGMKYDMCGSAAVFGVMMAACILKLPLNIIGVIPTAENMVSERATRPNDIVTTMSGKTVEILNTDAEGRLILCDALTYCEQFNPDVVIDVATLTGAAVATFGSICSAVLGNHNPLINDLLQAADIADDTAWQLPILPAYKRMLKSNWADLSNIGGGNAGTITAACFLAHFTEKFHWAHLDVAGTAADMIEGSKNGATGRPVPLLMHYLLERVQAGGKR